MPTLTISEVQQRDAERLLTRHGRIDLQVQRDGNRMRFSDELTMLVQRVLEAAANGGVIHIEAVADELTTSHAADMLGVSRPTVIKWIEQGKLDHRMVGSHRRVHIESVLKLRDERRRQRSESFDRLRELEEEHGVED